MRSQEEHTPSNILIKATLKIISSKEEALALYSALIPEEGTEGRRRALVRLKHSDQELTIEIESKDLPSARAVIGSYLRLINAASETIGRLRTMDRKGRKT